MLTDAEMILLTKRLKPADLPVGTHLVDRTVTLRIQGTVTRAQDKQRTPSQSLPHKRILAVLLDQLGPEGEAAIELAVQAAAVALDEGRDISEQLERWEAAEARITQMLRANLTPVTVRGDTRAAGEVIEVAGQPLEVLAEAMVS